MSDTKIDLTLKDLTPQEASVIIAYLGGNLPAMAHKAAAAAGKEEETPAPKKTAKKRATKKKPEPKPETKIEVVDKTEDDDDDWGDEDEGGGDDSKYASIKKWRELATVLVADGFNTEEKLLEKCQALRGEVPALEKIPDDNLVTRCSRAIELLGA